MRQYRNHRHFARALPDLRVLGRGSGVWAARQGSGSRHRDLQHMAASQREGLGPKSDSTLGELLHGRGKSGCVLGADFFARPARHVARELLGKALVRQLGRSRLSSIVTETEAYEGAHDLACHSARGRTARTEVMFGPPGRFYVYRIYGLHWMLNVVTGGIGVAAAVLVRGIDRASGPGRVTVALGIDSFFNGCAANERAGLWFEDVGHRLTRRDILRTARIGVDYAGPIWAGKKLRFILLSAQPIKHRRLAPRRIPTTP